jgi:hypothetical protein
MISPRWPLARLNMKKLPMSIEARKNMRERCVIVDMNDVLY